MRFRPARFVCLLAFAACPLILLSACGNWNTQAVYPTKVSGTDKILYTDQDPDSVFGTPAAHPVDHTDHTVDNTERNKHLWKAALESVSSMPIESLNASQNIILTDWYDNPDTPGQRLKFAISILDRPSAEDSLRVSVSRQVKDAGAWREAKAPEGMAESMKNNILAKAGGLRSGL